MSNYELPILSLTVWESEILLRRKRNAAVVKVYKELTKKPCSP